MSRPVLTELKIADPAPRWEALGFSVEDEHMHLGGVSIVLGVPGKGITGWSLEGIGPTDAIDGLPVTMTSRASAPRSAVHPNGSVALDHVVIVTPDFDRTAAALALAGLPLRRVRETQHFRQGFRRVGPAILELVEAPTAPPGPARFWGVVIVVPELESLAVRLSPHLTEPKAAVQPGRRIATVKPTAGLSPAVAFMTPEPA